MKRTILLILLIAPLLLSAQKRFTSGQVITAKGEILIGEVDYLEWVINPRKIRFRQDGSITIYGPKDLRSFRVDSKNEIYESAAVLVNTESLDWEEMPQFQTENEVDERIKMKQDTVFLLVLSRGKVNLYQLIDESKRSHFYFRKGNGAYEPLIYRGVKIMRPGQVIMPDFRENSILPRAMYFEDFKGQLKYALHDCADLESAIDKLTYSRSILDIVTQYNECSGQLIYVKPKDRAKHFVYAVAGRVQSNFRIDDQNNPAARELPSTWSNTFGIALNFGIPRTRSKFSWAVEALYMAAASSGSTTAGPLDINAKDLAYTMELEGFRINALLKYSLITGNIQPYLQFGIGNASYSKRSYTIKDLNTLQVRPNTLLKTEPFVTGGAGIKVHDFFVETRFDTGSDINRTTGYNARVQRFSLLIGYSLPLTGTLK